MRRAVAAPRRDEKERLALACRRGEVSDFDNTDLVGVNGIHSARHWHGCANRRHAELCRASPEAAESISFVEDRTCRTIGVAIRIGGCLIAC
jgi:hypothetical protein